MRDDNEVVGIILAGGLSSRFGTDKALSRLAGEPLIQRLCRTVGTAADRLMLITNAPEDYAFLGVESRSDLIPSCGPIGGLYTGLSAAKAPLCLCVACDMPFIRPAFLQYLVARSPGYDAVVPMRDGREEPLCAVYRNTCMPSIEDRIRARKYKMTGFFEAVRVLRLVPEDAGIHDADMFFNINSPADYEAALKRMRDQPRSA